VRIAKRFLAEQSIADAESEKLVPKPKKEISPASLQSAYDEDASFRRKGQVQQSGYLLEISETCDKENTFQLITDYTVEPNIISDVEILQGRLNKIQENTGCTFLKSSVAWRKRHESLCRLYTLLFEAGTKHFKSNRVV
jgi:hypothetical protein